MSFNIFEGPDGRPVAAKVTADGFMRVVVESGEGGGDASAANQEIQTARLDTLITGQADQLSATTGLATETTQALIRAAIETNGGKLDTIHTDLGTLTTEATQAAILAQLQASGATVDSILADTGAMLTALGPLATGADVGAVESAVLAGNASLVSIAASVAAGATAAKQDAIKAVADTISATLTSIKSDTAAINTNTDGVETLLGQIKTSTDKIPTLISARSPISLDGETTTAATLAATGALIKSGRGTAFQVEFRNTTGSAVFMQIHNRITAPTLSDRATWYAPTSTNNNQVGNLALGHATIGVPCSAGIWLVASTTQETFTSTGSTATSYNVIWQ